MFRNPPGHQEPARGHRPWPTKAAFPGGVVSAGGRVLGVAAAGADVREAQAAAYRAVDALDWPGGFCRRDIGWRALS